MRGTFGCPNISVHWATTLRRISCETMVSAYVCRCCLLRLRLSDCRTWSGFVWCIFMFASNRAGQEDRNSNLRGPCFLSGIMFYFFAPWSEFPWWADNLIPQYHGRLGFLPKSAGRSMGPSSITFRLTPKIMFEPYLNHCNFLGGLGAVAAVPTSQSSCLCQESCFPFCLARFVRIMFHCRSVCVCVCLFFPFFISQFINFSLSLSLCISFSLSRWGGQTPSWFGFPLVFSRPPRSTAPTSSSSTSPSRSRPHLSLLRDFALRFVWVLVVVPESFGFPPEFPSVLSLPSPRRHFVVCAAPLHHLIFLYFWDTARHLCPQWF